MKTSITTFNIAPYFDDYNVEDQSGKTVYDKNYHRILFNPSYAVQTRELNQVQSIFQNQIGELGKGLINVYHGGVVRDGEVEFSDNIRFIDVEMTNPITRDVRNNVDKITAIEIRKEINDTIHYIKATVLAVKYVEGEKYRFWFKYRNNEEDENLSLIDFTSGDILYLVHDKFHIDDNDEEKIGPNEEDENRDAAIARLPVGIEYDHDEFDQTYTSYSKLFGIGKIVDRPDADDETVSVTTPGWGFTINVKDGIFLAKGTLVKVKAQEEFYIKKRKDQLINGHIAFLILESIVTSEDDFTLRDNANGAYNYAAPGADRYKIELKLAFNINSALTGFEWIYDNNVKTGAIFDAISENSDFSAPYLNVRTILQNAAMNVVAPLSLSESLTDTFAERTYDESGNYTVKPYRLSVREIIKKNRNGGLHEPEVAKLNSELADLINAESVNEDNIDSLDKFLAVEIDTETAYVSGYRIQPGGKRIVYIKKGREISEKRNVGLTFSRGSYIDVVVDPTNTGVSDIKAILNDKIRGIEFKGVVSSSSLEGSVTVVEEDPRENFLIYRLYVYNNWTKDDLPPGFLPRWVPASLVSSSPVAVDDVAIKRPRNSTSYFPIGFKGIENVTHLNYSSLHTFEDITVNNSSSITLSQISNFVFYDNRISSLIVKYDGKYIEPRKAIEYIDIKNNGTDLEIEFKDDYRNGNYDFIIPLRSENYSFARRKKTRTSLTDQDLVVNCSTGIGVIDDQDVDISTIVCSDCGRSLSHLVIDDGLGDNFYENPILKFTSSELTEYAENVPPNEDTAVVKINYSYYEHGNESGFFDVTSYRQEGLENWFELIPKQGNGRLSDLIDFRVKRKRNFNSETGDFDPPSLLNNTNQVFLTPNYSGEIEFTHYLPRVDVVALSSSKGDAGGERGVIEIIEGIPSIDPVPRRVDSGQMSMYELLVPPYTYKPTDVRKSYIDNNRYTMADIGRLEKRIQNLEYYTSLSLLEKEAENRRILDLSEDGTGFERFKNGILVDSFMNHNVGDISNPDYSSAVNSHEQTMGPSFNVKNLRIKYAKRYTYTSGNTPYTIDTSSKPYRWGSIGDSTKQNGQKYIAPGFFGEEQISLDSGQRELFVENLFVTQTRSVQPYEVGLWTGQIKLSPSSDEWVDTERLPDFAVDFSAFSDFFQNVTDILVDLWGVDETLVSRTLVGSTSSTRVTGTRDATTVGRSHGTLTTSQTTTTNTFRDTFEQTWLTSSTQEVDIDFGDRVVDVSVVPWIRSRDIRFKGTGFKPNTKLYLFFDQENITDYAIQQEEFKLFSDTDDVATYTGETPSENSWGETWGSLKSDSFGSVTGILRIPNNDEFRFRTGVREFKLTDDPVNNDLEASTLGETVYNAMGLLQQKEFVGAAARVPEIQINQRRVHRTFTTTETRNQSRYTDPIAQTFYIDPSKYAAGVFLTDVEIFFAEKPSDPNSPVSVYLVKCENGTPTEYIVPGSKVTKRAKDINVSHIYPENDADILNLSRNVFTFDFPVYMQQGQEYALVVFGDTPEYRVWVSEFTQMDRVTGLPISKNPAFGVFLQSQNQRTWTPYQYINLAMRLHNAVFIENDQHAFTFTSDISDQTLSDKTLTYLQPFIRSLTPPGCRLDLSVKFKNDNGETLTTVGAKYVSSRIIVPGDELPFSHEVKNAKYIEVDVRLVSFNRYVSPIVDCETGSVYFRENRINNTLEGEGAIYNRETNEWSETSYTGGEALAKYITRRVVLNNPSEDLRVIMSVHRPVSTSSITVFAKRKITSRFDTSIQNETGWYEMQLYSVNGETDLTDLPLNRIGSPGYTDAEYALPLPHPSFIDADEFDEENTFTEFMIKVVFTSADAAQPCKIKNLMAIASI